MEYKFASDYAREIGQQIQSDIDRIMQARQAAADRAKEEQRYQEQQARYATSEERALRTEERQMRADEKQEQRYQDQLYGYTKTAMEVAPRSVDGWAVEGLQLALDEFQKASTQHRLEPTEANQIRMQQSKAQYENFKNVSTAKFAMNSQTINNVRGGKIDNLAGGVDPQTGMSIEPIEYAERMYADYSQAPEWVMTEDGKLMVASEGGLQDWSSTRYANTQDVFVPAIKAEETMFASYKFSEELFKNSFAAKSKSYTTEDANGYKLGELRYGDLYRDISDVISDKVRTNPRMLNQAAWEQWKRDNPGRGDMTEAEQREALQVYNPQLALTAVDGESISSGKLDENGRFVFNVTDAQLDAIPVMNSEAKRAVNNWRKTVAGYYESMAQGIAGRMIPVDQRPELAAHRQRQAIAQAEAEADYQENLQESLGATYAVGKREGGYSVSLPARDNVRVDLNGPGRVNVSQVLYDPQGNTVGYITSVGNDVIQATLSQTNDPEERAEITEYFNAYKNKPVMVGDPDFKAINLSVINDDKVAGRLQFVPRKIVGAERGLGVATLGSTGIDQGVLTGLQQQQQARTEATDMLPADLRP